ncbi:U3 snoRNP protein [Candidozyma auris]
MDGFIPLLSRNINSANEALTVVSMKVATTIVKLNFDAQRDTFFKEVFSKAVEFVMESPSTKAESSQVSLRYIATALRHKGCCFCTDNAVRALITKITPDLENPENQSAAFDLVRAILAAESIWRRSTI